MKINAHYRYHVQAWHESGLNQANYCRQQGINPKTFSRWVRLEFNPACVKKRAATPIQYCD